MKKGHKIVAALAAITLLPCATAGMLTACNNTPEEHTHSYTKWDFDDDEHWKVCPDDNAVDESSKAEHDFDSDGKCECGATETYVYGTVTGKVKLHKNNAYEKAEGITVDMGDDDVNITGSVGEDGVYSFTVAKVKVKHDYTLTISKTGYTSYSTNIYLEEENEVAPIGGNDGITLEYEVFNIYLWDGASHDLSNVNAANPSIKWVGPAKTMNVISKENTYTDLSVAVTIKKSFSSDGSAEQGIMLQFEDGAGAFLNINVDGVARLQFRPKFHSGAADKKSIFLTPENQDKWVEYRTVTAEEVKQYESDAGIELKLVRNGDYLYTFLGGRFMGKQELPEDYKDDKIAYGFYCFGANVGSEWTYEVTEDFPALESEITVDVTLPEDETECTVARTPVKGKYELGEEVTLTFNAPVGYKLDALTINGADKYAAVEGNALTITVDRAVIEVEATFVKEQPIDISVTVKGKKLGTTAALAENTQVTLSGIETPFAVNAEGKITGEGIVKGRYTVTVEGYLPTEITLDENLEEITLEYDTFKQTLGWGKFNFTEQNADTPKFGITNDCAVILTKDTYGSGVMASIYLKGENMNAGNGGLVFSFVGEGMDAKGETVTIVMQNTKKVQVAEDKLWNTTTVAGGCKWNNMIYFVEGEDDNAYRYADKNSAEYLEDYGKGELKFSVLREESTFYVYLNGRFVGKHTIDDKYKTARCEVGFVTSNLGNSTDWKYWNVDIDENVQRDAVTITDAIAADHGSVAIPQNIKVGDTIQLSATAASGYIFEALTVKNAAGETVQTTFANGKYSFVAFETAYTVTATFIDAPANEAQANVAGIGLGNTDIDMKDKTVSFKAENGTVTELIVNSESVVKGILLPGTYTVSVAGFYDLTATVGADGEFVNLDNGFKFEKVIFTTNGINEPTGNIFGWANPPTNTIPNPVLWSADNTHLASTGKFVAVKDGKMYEWTGADASEQFNDVAFTVKVKSGNGDQTIIMRFGGEQKDVRVRFQSTGDNSAKAQWQAGGWWNGSFPIIDSWNTAGDFGSGEAYANNMSADLYAKFNGDGLTLTMLRKGAMVYALIDGEIYAAQYLGDGFAGKKVRIAYFSDNSKTGYEVPFVIDTNVDAILDEIAGANKVASVLGKWTVTETTLAVTGKGYAEFAPGSEAVKESLAITLKNGSSNAGKKAQGVLYRFADGKWLAARMETTDSETYIQYANDMILPKVSNPIFDWAKIKDFDKSLLTDGVSLKMVRDGKFIYVVLGNEVIDVKTLDDKYATMDGVFATTLEGGLGAAFAYEYKSGDETVVPAGYYTATAAIEGNAYGYSISLDKQIVKSGGSVTVTIQTSNADVAWSHFPNALKVNDDAVDFSTVTRESLGANRCKYTYTVSNVTANTAISVTIDTGTKVAYDVTVNDETMGTVESDMGGYDSSNPLYNAYFWNDLCTWTITATNGYELEKIVIGEGDDATEITEGWTQNGNVYTYKHTVVGDIKAVMHFKAVEQTPPVTE